MITPRPPDNQKKTAMSLVDRSDVARTWLVGVALCLLTVGALAHGICESNQYFLQGATRVPFLPYLYLGAKRMVTGCTTCCSCAA